MCYLVSENVYPNHGKVGIAFYGRVLSVHLLNVVWEPALLCSVFMGLCCRTLTRV